MPRKERRSHREGRYSLLKIISMRSYFRPFPAISRRLFSSFKNYYEVLGVSKTATKQEIKDAYVKLSKKFHPDANGASTSGDRSSHDKFVQINEAYRVLSREESRREYDRSLEHGYQQPPERRYQPPPKPPFYESPFDERQQWPQRPFGGNWGFRSPFDDPWLREYFRQERAKASEPTPEEKRKLERTVWLYILSFIAVLTFLQLLFSERNPHDRGYGHGELGPPYFERQMQEQERLRTMERFRQQQEFREKILREEEARKRLEEKIKASQPQQPIDSTPEKRP